jgi:mRNA interferase RelE/StbE
VSDEKQIVPATDHHQGAPRLATPASLARRNSVAAGGCRVRPGRDGAIAHEARHPGRAAVHADATFAAFSGRREPMYQVTFSEQAMRELNRLDKLAQLDAIEPISALKATDLANPREPLGQFRRGQRSLYRLRSGDFRFYFEVSGDNLHVLYILHRNSLEDFLLRNKLPVTEQQLVEQHSKFWKYLESLTK